VALYVKLCKFAEEIHTPLKKLLPVILAILLLFNTGGFYIVFKSLQYGVKKEIKEKIRRSLPGADLTLIRICSKYTHSRTSLLKWYDDGKEFVYMDRMYDIIKQETRGDSVYFYCINDTKEEQLFAGLNGIVNKTMGEDSLKQKMLKTAFQLTQNFYFIHQNNSYTQNCTGKVIYYPMIEYPLYIFHEVIVPPPKNLS